MRYLIACFIAAVTVLTLPRASWAKPGACDSLQGPKRALAESLLKSQHPYDCCDGTLWECLSRKPVCRLARRLSEDICRRVAAGQQKAQIERELVRRASSMMPSKSKASIALANLPPAGDAKAKVTAVAYLCARCPFCARLLPQLHQSVVAGKLSGKVKLYVRVFPVRGHAGATEGGLALVAARKLGKFWEFIEHVYANFDRFDQAKLPDCAAAKGMDRKRFVQLMKDRKTRKELVNSKKEGVRNNVDATPTLFINGRKYMAELSLNAIEDVLLEEYERVTGQIHE
ncbi:DsbA family protein [Myxococcota bacterium]